LQAPASLGNEKMRVLSVLDDNSIQTLSDGGSIAGMTLDDVEKMTTRELRENLRKEREKRKKEKGAQELVIEQKEKKINELEQQCRYQEPPTKEDIARGELEKLTKDYTEKLGTAMGAFQAACNLIRQGERIPNVNSIQINEWIHKHDDMVKLLNGAYQEFITAVDFADEDFGNILSERREHESEE
jgi:hypothetical protein